MAFTFDSTVGGTASNSYGSVEEFDDLFDGRYENEYWTALSTDDKERIAVTATRRIDQETFNANKVTSTQALQFPMEPIFDRNGDQYATDAIPLNLQLAAMELIYFMLSSDDRILSDIELYDAKYLEGYSVGPLDYKYGKVKTNELPQNVKDELMAMGEGIWETGKNPSVIYR